MRLPPIVLVLIAQGIADRSCSPPSDQRDVPLDRDSVQQNGVRVPGGDVPVDGDVGAAGRRVADGTHGCPVVCPGGLGRQPRPRSEPGPAVTSCPTVIVDGALCASSTAPAATFTLPTTVITASGATAAGARHRDAGVDPRRDADEVPRGEITTGARIRPRPALEGCALAIPVVPTNPVATAPHDATNMAAPNRIRNFILASLRLLGTPKPPVPIMLRTFCRISSSAARP